MLAFGILLAAICASSVAAVAEAGPDNDPKLVSALQDAGRLIKEKKLAAAVEICDATIARFRAAYSKRRETIYCAQTSAESLDYLLMATAGKNDAVVLSPTWADAYFIKGYALQDLGRLAEAKASILLALKLSPWNAHYLCEMGEIYQLEKNWPKARQAFVDAEEHTSLLPDQARAAGLARARRGQGYVYVELGQLKEAEKKYEQCLATDPNDTRAKNELTYVRHLQVKAKSK